MRTYVAVFSSITGKSAVHADGCRCASKRTGMTRERVQAEDARGAAARFYVDAELEALGWPRTTVAPCAKVGR